jgi:hypothetical protein
VPRRRLWPSTPLLSLPLFGHPKQAENRQDFRAKNSPKLDQKNGQFGRVFALYGGESFNKGSNQNAVT